MNTIDSIQVSLNAGGMNTINIILAFVMYGVALGIKPHIFVEVFRKPKSVLLGMLCQMVLLPAFTCRRLSEKPPVSLFPFIAFQLCTIVSAH